MLNLSIMPLDTDHIDEIVEDIIEQQRTGVSTHAMFMMEFNPEGTPAVNKAELQCEKYDLFRERLDKHGARHGVLVQATLGHIYVPYEPYAFQPTVSLPTGEERVVTCCPLDPDYRKYIKEQFRILAERHPSVVMLDDDLGLFYRPTGGCACKYHMAELNRRAKKAITREELYQHVLGNTEEDKYYSDLYVEVVRDSIVDCVKAMREGLDEVDPTIQGVVSGIYTSTFCEFSDYTAEAFAGKGNPKIIRLNGGPYSNSANTGGARNFTANMFRAAILRENTKDKVDVFLAETDTCPHNRYSTSAALLHTHFTASILEGAMGAKHWITRLTAFEPASGKAYRKKLAKYSGFYEALTTYASRLRPFGCRIPLTRKQDFFYQLRSKKHFNLSAWSSCVLERLGLPFYFGNDGEGAVFLDDFSVRGFTDDEIREFMKGTLILSVGAADALASRGFASELGVTVASGAIPIDQVGVQTVSTSAKVATGELVNGISLDVQYGNRALTPLSDETEWLSEVYHFNQKQSVSESLYPGVTRHKTSLGGECIVFCGTPDMPFKYYSAFSLLNETRKRQLVDILSKNDLLPVYYPEDAELYLRAGRLPGGEIFAAAFNLSQDAIDELPLVIMSAVSHIDRLNERGERIPCDFEVRDGVTYVKYSIAAMEPLALIIG
ncbi:MAG: hypothetical protein J6S71_07695 [Clostridia bacterium]|nr:hypothetical protein [Clostridia bacterium]